MLTKKHFESIAQIIRESTIKTHNPDFEYINKEQLVNSLAEYFATQNERANEDKFFKACYR